MRKEYLLLPCTWQAYLVAHNHDMELLHYKNKTQKLVSVPLLGWAACSPPRPDQTILGNGGVVQHHGP